ncbi:MAG: pentapeptide repeat-containing protein [Methanothrix sp.]|nr:pentapeptide repeat-containing protein [Methanothrix sp.]NLX37992.1 hypothetical protein [Methanothrix sp.]
MERNYIKFILLSSMALISILAPALGQDGYNLVPADDLLKRIEEGKEVSYDHVIIDGRLDSARLDLDESETGKKIINVPIIIRNSTIKDCVDLNYVMFNKPVYMYNTTFKEHCNMTYSIFKGRADFSHSKFEDNVNFLYTHFAADAFFGRQFFRKMQISGRLISKRMQNLDLLYLMATRYLILPFSTEMAILIAQYSMKN